MFWLGKYLKWYWHVGWKLRRMSGISRSRSAKRMWSMYWQYRLMDNFFGRHDHECSGNCNGGFHCHDYGCNLNHRDDRHDDYCSGRYDGLWDEPSDDRWDDWGTIGYDGFNGMTGYDGISDYDSYDRNDDDRYDNFD